MTQPWQPYREPLRSTLLRTVTIALVLGLTFALSRGHLSQWPAATLLALWPAFGGHWVEIVYLNYLRPHLGHNQMVQILARIAVWFAAGILIAAAISWTAMLLPGFYLARTIPWWIGGFGFILIELVAHLAMLFRGRPSFYNGRG
jgi:hypothetical protein